MTTVAGIDVTHPDKVLLPAREGGEDVTKADLAQYWESVAPTVLKHLTGRPLTLQRFPDGLDAGGFVQQDAGKRAPKGLHTVDTPRRERKKDADDVVHHPEVEETADLIRLVQFGTVTLHGWNAVAGALERPDRLIVDIDPGERQDLAGIRDVARAVRHAVEGRGLVAFLQSTGSRGYHVVAPLDGSADQETVRNAAIEIAEAVAADDPDEPHDGGAQGRPRRPDLPRHRPQRLRPDRGDALLAAGPPGRTDRDAAGLGRARPRHARPARRPLDPAPPRRKTDPWAGFAEQARPLS